MNKPASHTTQELTLKIKTDDMSPAQVRLLKRIHTLLIHTLTAEDEGEYFEASAELLQQAVQLVRHSHFPENTSGKIPYADQAVEYAVDFLNEALTTPGGNVNLDN